MGLILLMVLSLPFVLQVKLEETLSFHFKYLASHFFHSSLKDVMVSFSVNSYAGALRYFLIYEDDQKF